MDDRPESADLVCLYRPAAEHEAIIENKAIPLQAKTLWLQAPISSAQTARLAAEQGLIYIENTDIAEIAEMIKKS